MAANHLKYIDYSSLALFNETVNKRLYRRLKYRGELPLLPDTRTDWNDIAPCTIGHMYVLTGDEGDSITIDDVEYNVGDTIYAVNDVNGLQDPPVDVVVNKISAGSKAIIQVYNLDDIAKPKEHLFYQIINDDDDETQLYVLRGTTWHRVYPPTQYIRVSDFATVTEKQKTDYNLFYLDTDIVDYDHGLYIYDVDLQDFIPATDKPIIQVQDLAEVAEPKETMFYEVTNEDTDDIELYVYRGNTWHEVIRHPFEIVESALPDAANIVQDKMFLLKNDETDADDPAVIVHKEGLWLFDKATETYIDMAEPIDEDFINELDIQD